ncbi:DUF3431 domain-containing protein [Aspergillus affinis]|uniref:DUF3431 domain-containing protein n=1 Tax=Aspergillus affinis TaxID=1070780 RepID=UPI0022FE847F|nr:uncharacterized protein KD926_001640 [Aspergillus affinis]KAI9036627.1 hypothetical protein KD926_001640 [Aspergillus affinis]
MSKRRVFRWPARRTAGLGCVALIFTSILSLMMYTNRSFEPEPDTGPVYGEVMRQLSEITTNYSNATGVGLVLAATQTEDLNWLLNYCRDYGTTPFVYTTDATPEPHLIVPRTTRGREAAAYLSFVVDYYDHLPDYTIFIHSNRDQWHNDLFGSRTSSALRHLRLEAVDAQGYVNLRCEHDPGCPTNVHPWSPTQIDIDKNDIRAFFPQVYQTLFNVGKEKVPDHIGNVCCGQFAVSRERILQRPRHDYERMLKWAAETELTDSFGVGWVFEKVWHVVFGMEDIYCPRFEQCRCDTYGWCGPLASGETLQAVRVHTGKHKSGLTV